MNIDTIETEPLNEKSEKVGKSQNAADVIKEYEEILRTKRKDIISAAYHQRKVLSRFREKEKFVGLVANFKIHKDTMILKINVFKLINNIQN